MKIVSTQSNVKCEILKQELIHSIYHVNKQKAFLEDTSC